MFNRRIYGEKIFTPLSYLEKQNSFGTAFAAARIAEASKYVIEFTGMYFFIDNEWTPILKLCNQIKVSSSTWQSEVIIQFGTKNDNYLYANYISTPNGGGFSQGTIKLIPWNVNTTKTITITLENKNQYIISDNNGNSKSFSLATQYNTPYRTGNEIYFDLGGQTIYHDADHVIGLGSHIRFTNYKIYLNNVLKANINPVMKGVDEGALNNITGQFIKKSEMQSYHDAWGKKGMVFLIT